jgi:hypothetical protein
MKRTRAPEVLVQAAQQRQQMEPRDLASLHKFRAGPKSLPLPCYAARDSVCGCFKISSRLETL